MKMIINYYYNMYPSDIIKKEEQIEFIIDNITYELIETNIDIKNLIDIYYKIIYLNLYCHEIVLNRFGEYVTNYNNKQYVLLKKYKKTKLTIDDINLYSIPINIKLKLPWKNLWQDRIDYYEYQLRELKFDFEIKGFDYYIGLGETAIEILNYINLDNIYYSLGHKNFTDFYNPLNFIIVPRVRDIAEYIKYLYFYKNINIEEVKKILNIFLMSNNLTSDEILLLISRLIYPTYYFNKYDQIIKNSETEDFKNIIKKSSEYEQFIKDIYNKLRYKYNLIIIDWLI